MDGDTIIIAPPFIINEDDVELIVDRTSRAIKAFFESAEYVALEATL